MIKVKNIINIKYAIDKTISSKSTPNIEEEKKRQHRKTHTYRMEWLN